MADVMPLQTISRRRRLRRLGQALVGLLIAAPLGMREAAAVDGTWTGGTTDWGDPANWSSAAVPDGTASFTNSGLTGADSNGIVAIGSIQFNAAASSFTINSNDFFVVTGTGVFNNSTVNAQTFNALAAAMTFLNTSTASGGAGVVNYNNSSFLNFNDASTAGSAMIANSGIMQLSSTSSAGTAQISNDGTTNFFDSSTAGTATINNNAAGTLVFANSSSAQGATIVNDGGIQFLNSAVAGTAGITNNGTLDFSNSSSADHAVIGNNSLLRFYDTGTAGNATINNAAAGTLTFNDSSTAQAATIINDGGVQFNNTSKAGTAAITNNNTLDFLGASSADHATITNNAAVTFSGTSTADHAAIAYAANSASTQFSGSSSAGSATFQSNAGVIGNYTSFFNASTAGSATILNSIGTVTFTDTASAGSANISNTGSTVFGQATTSFAMSSTAGNATIINADNGFTQFDDQSVAGTATIINNPGGITTFGLTASTASADHANILNAAGSGGIGTGGVTFFFSSTTAGNATITTQNAAGVFLSDTSSGGAARFITDVGGVFDISQLTSTGTTAGSIEGAGTYYLGSKQLTVGGNNLSTTVSGIVSDGSCGCFGPGGTGGSLVKVGTGTLTLAGANTYTGATTVNEGTLSLTGSLLNSSVTVGSGAAFAGTGTAAGAVSIQSGGHLAPGVAGVGNGVGTLTVAALALNTGANLNLDLGTPNVVGGTANDLVTDNGALTLGGTVNVNALAGFGAGAYRLINYSGALTDNGLTVAGLPAGSSGIVQALGGQVNLLIGGANGVPQYWNGATTAADGTLHGGTGNWTNANSNWTDAAGNFTERWVSGTGIFAGAAGTVSVNDAIAFQALQFSTSGYTIAAGTGALTATGAASIITDSGVATSIAASIGGTAGLTKTGTGTLALTGANTYSGGTIIAGGTLSVSADNNLGAASGGLTINGSTLQVTGPGFASARDVTLAGAGGTLQVDSGALTVGGVISGSALTKSAAGTLILTGTNTYTGGTTIAAGTLQLGAGGTSGSIVGNVANNGILAIDRSDSYLYSGVVSGTGALQTNGTGTTILTGANTYTGGTAIAAGTLQLGAGGNSGAIVGNVADNGVLAINRSDNYLFAGAISGTGALRKDGAGITTLSGTSSYTGTTTVNSGTLSVDGSIAASSLTTVNAGATLAGIGTVGNTLINGGTLSPGNSPGTLTVQGNVVLTAAASYLVEVTPTVADRVNVTGSATLGGAALNAQFAAGSYINKQYTIVNASGGVVGTFAAQIATNLSPNLTRSLSYDANNAYLHLALDFTPGGGGLNRNQQNVANTLENYFNRTGGIPLAFGGLTPTGLTQVSGETATGAQQTTIDAMNLFLGLLTDPFVAGRNAPAAGPAAFADDDAATAYAASRRRSGAEREAYGMITKAVPPPAFEQRWSAWAAGFGGSQTTDGNAGLGANTATSRIYGGAAGADYWFSPQTVAGFALAGGGTSFSVANAGSGQSDLFQAGAFVRHAAGAAYVTAALAYGWQDITTDRTVTVAGVDRLHAQFNANAWSGRVEGGYRVAYPWLAITPYAAGQFTTFELPSYAETAIGANTFALAYAGKTVTATRSELGLRSDRSWALGDGMFTLRGRAAWAHDFNTDRNVQATFQTLPGTSFVVNGAPPARDAALATGSAEWTFASGLALAATFEGEFSDVTRSYAGKGVVRYAW